MGQLLRHGRTVATVFDLLGFLENDMTDSLAFTLSRSQSFLRTFLADVGYSQPLSEEDVILSVQTRRPGEGITDLEIQIGNSLFAILEAKRGSALPTPSQLRLYALVIARHAAFTKMLTHLRPQRRHSLRPPSRTARLRVSHLNIDLGGKSATSLFRRALRTITMQNACFALGPAIIPPRDVLAGTRVRRNNRVWCMIDTLLTSSTVSDALTETKKRCK
jgi:hypothetical protein